jgi:hypothetical protein
MRTDELVEIVLDVDLNIEPACESVHHDPDPDHTGPGRFWMRTPCGHYDGIRCPGFVMAVQALGWLHCDACDATRTVSRYRFIEL